MKTLCFLAATLPSISFASNLRINAYEDSTLLINHAMIMTHDAGTAYIQSNSIEQVVYGWTKTQSAIGNRENVITFAEQLSSCGVRSFDVRTKVDGSNIFMHHGDIEVKYLFSDAMKDIISFTASNDDLVLVYLSHCDGADCENAQKKVLNDLSIYVEEDCNVFSTLTISQAKSKAQSLISTQGNIYAVSNCVNENYDSSIECYSGVEACYGVLKSDKFLNNMFSSLDKIGSSNYLSMFQAHWQYSASSVAAGVTHLSSIIDDESKANVNSNILQQLKTGRWPNMNILELDNACDAGQEIYDYFKTSRHVEKPSSSIILTASKFFYSLF